MILLLECMLNNIFPLNANTWGTVSDWIMVVVTAITAYYLYKTLQSQMLVTKIEHENFKISAEPTIEIDKEMSSLYLNTFTLDFKCSKSNSFNIRLEYFSIINYDIKTQTETSMAALNDMRIGDSQKVLILIPEVSENDRVLTSIDIYYTDAIGTKYLKRTSLEIDADKKYNINSRPVMNWG